MTPTQLKKEKSIKLDPILEDIISFYVINIKKIRDAREKTRIAEVIRSPLHQQINPMVINFITNPDNHQEVLRIKRRKKRERIYSIENRAKRAIRELVEEYHKYETRRNVRFITKHCSILIENAINDERFYKSVMAII